MYRTWNLDLPVINMMADSDQVNYYVAIIYFCMMISDPDQLLLRAA